MELVSWLDEFALRVFDGISEATLEPMPASLAIWLAWSTRFW